MSVAFKNVFDRNPDFKNFYYYYYIIITVSGSNIHTYTQIHRMETKVS